MDWFPNKKKTQVRAVARVAIGHFIWAVFPFNNFNKEIKAFTRMITKERTKYRTQKKQNNLDQKIDRGKVRRNLNRFCSQQSVNPSQVH